MKKIFLLYLSLFIFITANANEAGHFFVDLSSQNVSVANISSSFSNYVNVASGSTFTLFRDTTDGLGIRHQSYQQYVQGIKVQSFMILVHSKNGKVKNINGAVMSNSALPQSSPAKISRKQAARKAPSQIADSSVTMIFYCLDGVFYKVYKVPSPETFETLYIDVTSGDILYRESAFRNADVIGRGYTRYNGWQNMTVYENDGRYFLMDEGRNIVTMSAQNVSPNYNYYTSAEFINSLPSDVLSVLQNPQSSLYNEYRYQYVLTPMMTDYIQNSCITLYTSRANVCAPIIKSITITDAASSWWYDIWDTKPDLYCQICDANGVVLYTTNTKDDCTLPVTFNLPYNITVDEGYIIKIYDEDATSDSYGGSVTLNSVTAGSKTWSGSNTSGYVVIAENPTEYADIHWGMQKTIDFYQQTFNRNGFDGNGHIVINLAFPPQDNYVFKTMPYNAAAQSVYEPFYMYYGKGDETNMNPYVSLDVMAHEFTHMVTGTNGNGGLDYKLESGALNESFSDIMAMGVMQYTLGNCPWTIGEDIMVNAPNMRSMTNPKNSEGANGDTLKGAQPDTYKGQCWSYIPASIDTNQVVVHRNSGVQNYWFFLLSEGGIGTNDNNDSYSVAGIGMDKALQIAFRNLLFYLTPCATFEDSRNGSIQSAIDLYGKDSQEHQSVVNAWYAVGVGNAYVPESEITISAKMPNDWGTTITAWTWQDGSEGQWATLVKDGEWYSYTTTANHLNIVFVNGFTWNGDNNQSIDIRLTESACIELGSNTGKRTYTIISCEEEPETNNYVVLAQRNATSNWFYMTSDLGTASNKRYQAVDAGTNSLASVNTSNLESKYYWQIEENKLHTAAGYSAWISGNTAILDETGKELNVEKQTDGTYTFSFADGTNTRYLALNKTVGNNYFAYYSGTNQIYKLTLVKEGEKGTATAIEEISSQQETLSATKVLRDGQIYILRGDKTYTLQGQEVK